MPIFEYRCRDCDHQFERIVFRNSEAIECPECESPQTEKLFSSFAVSSGSNSASSSNTAACGSGKFT